MSGWMPCKGMLIGIGEWMICKGHTVTFVLVWFEIKYSLNLDFVSNSVLFSTYYFSNSSGFQCFEWHVPYHSIPSSWVNPGAFSNTTYLSSLQFFCWLWSCIGRTFARTQVKDSTCKCFSKVQVTNSIKDRVHCFSMQVVINKYFLLNLEKKLCITVLSFSRKTHL